MRASPFTISEPCPDRGVADCPSIPAPDDRARKRGAVADVEVEAGKCLVLVDDRDEVRRVEDRRSTGRDAVADCRRSQRVLHRKRLKPDPQHRQWPARLHDPALGEGIASDRAPGRRGRVYRARGTVSKPGRVVGVRVREDDRSRAQPRKPIAPVEATIDHHLAAAVADEQRAVASVPARSRLDFAPRAEEPKPHRGSNPGAS